MKLKTNKTFTKKKKKIKRIRMKLKNIIFGKLELKNKTKKKNFYKKTKKKNYKIKE
jgi:hypothetical protein